MNGTVAVRARVLVIGTLSVAIAVTLAACSTSSSTKGTGRTGRTGTTAPAPAPKAKAASAPKASGPLSGKWSGHYSGSYNGTFSLTWRETGSHLHGTIRISNPGDTFPINGNVSGNTITFGTVGSMAITYTGTVSGNSMSGTYKVQTANGPTGGPWSASRG